ncbi:MAG: hypothetical protein IPM79_22850 [Polyangiaceae bacterium]|nr:hypothetical protein [Polyangiaceae bacterium]
MPPYVACSSCSCHVAPGSTECPHCGASIATTGAPLRTAATILLDLGTAIVACEEPGEAYGAPGGYSEGGGQEGGTGGTGGSSPGGAPEGGGGASAGGGGASSGGGGASQGGGGATAGGGGAGGG